MPNAGEIKAGDWMGRGEGSQPNADEAEYLELNTNKNTNTNTNLKLKLNLNWGLIFIVRVLLEKPVLISRARPDRLISPLPATLQLAPPLAVVVFIAGRLSWSLLLT